MLRWFPPETLPPVAPEAGPVVAATGPVAAAAIAAGVYAASPVSSAMRLRVSSARRALDQGSVYQLLLFHLKPCMRTTGTLHVAATFRDHIIRNVILRITFWAN